MLVLSWVGAIVASVGYGLGSFLQSVGARRTAHVAGVTGVALILVQAPYLLGLGVDLVAFVGNVVALQRLPLFLVQSILTASVGVTAVIAAVRGTRLTWKDWTSLAVLGVGLVLLAATATAETAVPVSESSRYVILASAVAPLTIGVLGRRLRGRASWLLTGFGAGLAFTGVAVSSRGVSSDSLSPAMLADPLIWAIAVHGVVGAVLFALALQRGPVTSVTAMTFMVEMVVPAVVGLLLFGDSVHPGDEIFALLGFVLAITGTISLMRFAE